MDNNDITILGIESGIGSMMIGAKEFGCNIIGNIESRKEFYTGTFEKNFNGFMVKSLDQVCDLPPINIIFAHPKCGDFSALNTNKKKKDNSNNIGFNNVISGIQTIKPEFFLIDNLPKSLEFYPLIWWSKQLLDYDITIEYVSNYNYGNVQKHRNRLFIIGSKKEYKFVFIPNEKGFNGKIRHVFEGLEQTDIKNHDIMPQQTKAPGFMPYTLAEAKAIIKGLKIGKNVYYIKKKGTIKYTNQKVGKMRIGMQILDINKPSPTITGSLAFYRGDLLRPLTCRERARIQGIPDWFEFVLKGKDRFNDIMGSQTGKCIPVQFTRYFTEFVINFLKLRSNLMIEILQYSGKRRLNDKLVNDNKEENCKEYSHSNQNVLCDCCDFKSCRSKI